MLHILMYERYDFETNVGCIGILGMFESYKNCSRGNTLAPRKVGFSMSTIHLCVVRLCLVPRGVCFLIGLRRSPIFLSLCWLGLYVRMCLAILRETHVDAPVYCLGLGIVPIHWRNAFPSPLRFSKTQRRTDTKSTLDFFKFDTIDLCWG